MKELISTRIEPEMKRDLSKLARLYRVYEPDLYRMAFSQFIINHHDKLKQFDEGSIYYQEQKMDKEELFDEVLDTGIHYDKSLFHAFDFDEGTYSIMSKPINVENKNEYQYECEFSFTPANTDITKSLFSVEFDEQSFREEGVREEQVKDDYYDKTSGEELLFHFLTEVMIDLRLSEEHTNWIKEFSGFITAISSEVKRKMPFTTI